MVLIGKVIDDYVGRTSRVYRYREEICQCSVTARDVTIQPLSAELAIVRGMLARLDLVDRWAASRCALHLDEIRKPFRAIGGLTIILPRRERVRVSPGTGSVEDNVDNSGLSSYGPGHDVGVGRITVYL